MQRHELADVSMRIEPANSSKDPVKILGLIPARGGSKRVRRKNLRMLHGLPLLEYTFMAAQGCPQITRLLVSTDDEEIAEFATKRGLEVPFRRPPELASDTASAKAVMQHAINHLQQDHDPWHTDIVVYLQPTSPLRTAEHVTDGIELLISSRADTVVSVTQVPHQYVPQSIMTLEGGALVPYMPKEILRAQDKPVYYARNGPAVLVSTRAMIMSERELYAGRVAPLPMGLVESIDIDTEEDLLMAEYFLRSRQNNVLDAKSTT